LLKPSIELLVAALFWGFGFVGTVWVLPFLSPSAIIAYRFLTAFIVGICFFPWVNWREIKLIREIKYSVPAGLGLGLCLFLQTWGLEMTSATNSGFITTLYVVLVPFIARIFLKERLHPLHWLCVGIALFGTALIVQLGTVELNAGDLLTLACALVASVQIVYIGVITHKSKNSFVMNSLQSFWAGAPFLAMLLLGKGKWNILLLDRRAWVGMIILTFGATVLAFYLQLKAQKDMPSSLASLFYLLESPFSCLFAIIFLGEVVTPRQYLGAALILASCGLAVYVEKRRRTG
jgi:drug/metabolite transporter (DMT)-like permease